MPGDDFIFDGDTPSLEEAIDVKIANDKAKSFSALPGKIVSYDAGRQCATGRSVVKARASGATQTIPDMPCMPVALPSGTGPGGKRFSIVYPISPGDGCLTVFSSVATGQYYQNGNEDAEPEGNRRQSLSDGVVIPGLNAFGTLTAPSMPGLRMGLDDDSATVVILETGEIFIKTLFPEKVVINGGTHPVAAADLTETEIDRLGAAINAIAPGSYVKGLTPPVLPSTGAATRVDDLETD